MATILTAGALVNITANLTGPSGIVGSIGANLSKTLGASLAQGTGAGQADVVYWAERTLAASTNEDLDLTGTALQDPLGTNIALARIKAFIIGAAAGNANNVVVGNAASNGVAGLFGAVTHTAIVRPGAVVCWICGLADATGYAITAGTADLLRVANSAGGTSVTYDIVIIGASA